jgi:predicted dithiol-disulfide oxidoreductase (DUF899 family)
MTMQTGKVVSRDEWLAARLELLEEEKAHLRARDALAAQRRALPWVRVETPYVFRGPRGELTLSQLFADKSQLIVMHFMFGEGWEEACPSCSFWADGYDGTTVHMAHRDAAFVAVSNCPLARIEAYRKRMGWSFAWVSCHGTSFGHDFHVSFTPQEMERGEVEYNYRRGRFPSSEAPGASVFARDDAGAVYHTYSCFSRGLDNLNVAYQFIDLLPKGRDEEGLSHAMAWVRRHDRYE